MMAASSQRKREMRKRTRGKPPLAGNEMLDHSQDHYSTEVVIGRFKGELVLLDSAREEDAAAASAPPPQATPRIREQARYFCRSKTSPCSAKPCFSSGLFFWLAVPLLVRRDGSPDTTVGGYRIAK